MPATPLPVLSAPDLDHLTRGLAAALGVRPVVEPAGCGVLVRTPGVAPAAAFARLKAEAPRACPPAPPGQAYRFALAAAGVYVSRCAFPLCGGAAKGGPPAGARAFLVRGGAALPEFLLAGEIEIH